MSSFSVFFLSLPKCTSWAQMKLINRSHAMVTTTEHTANPASLDNMSLIHIYSSPASSLHFIALGGITFHIQHLDKSYARSWQSIRDPDSGYVDGAGFTREMELRGITELLRRTLGDSGKRKCLGEWVFMIISESRSSVIPSECFGNVRVKTSILKGCLVDKWNIAGALYILRHYSNLWYLASICVILYVGYGRGIGYYSWIVVEAADDFQLQWYNYNQNQDNFVRTVSGETIQFMVVVLDMNHWN